MRILLVAPEFPPQIGGMETYAFELTRQLAKEQEVAILSRPDATRVPGAQMLQYYENEYSVPVAVSDFKPECIHLLNSGLAPIIPTLRKKGFTTIVTVHGKDALQPWLCRLTELKKGLLEADGIIAVSPMVQKRLAKMNLAVHGLEGKITKAITYYEDPHEMLDKADFVMANPPFNVDEVDAEKIKNDPRLPFGLPGVNKKGTVSNGNYLWISYFYSYLNDQGRAGFVMSSQASSSGGQEAEVRRKLVETGDVSAMIAIRSNFFYTRSVPCELWFFNKNKSLHFQ